MRRCCACVLWKRGTFSLAQVTWPQWSSASRSQSANSDLFRWIGDAGRTLAVESVRSEWRRAAGGARSTREREPPGRRQEPASPLSCQTSSGFRRKRPDSLWARKCPPALAHSRLLPSRHAPPECRTLCVSAEQQLCRCLRTFVSCTDLWQAGWSTRLLEGLRRWQAA